MIDPRTLDPGGAWLLDRIASRTCHLYFCGLAGKPTTVTYMVTLQGKPRMVTLQAFACHAHR